MEAGGEGAAELGRVRSLARSFSAIAKSADTGGSESPRPAGKAPAAAAAEPAAEGAATAHPESAPAVDTAAEANQAAAEPAPAEAVSASQAGASAAVTAPASKPPPQGEAAAVPAPAAAVVEGAAAADTAAAAPATPPEEIKGGAAPSASASAEPEASGAGESWEDAADAAPAPEAAARPASGPVPSPFAPLAGEDGHRRYTRDYMLKLRDHPECRAKPTLTTEVVRPRLPCTAAAHMPPAGACSSPKPAPVPAARLRVCHFLQALGHPTPRTPAKLPTHPSNPPLPGGDRQRPQRPGLHPGGRRL